MNAWPGPPSVMTGHTVVPSISVGALTDIDTGDDLDAWPELLR